MKLIFALALSFLTLAAFGQGTAIRSAAGGRGTNTTLVNPSTTNLAVTGQATVTGGIIAGNGSGVSNVISTVVTQNLAVVAFNNNGAAVSNVVASAVTSAVTNQWRIDGTNIVNALAGHEIPLTVTTFFATNAPTGSWVAINKEVDDTWSLQFSAANGNAGAGIYVNPSTGVLRVSGDPSLVEQSLVVNGILNGNGAGLTNFPATFPTGPSYIFNGKVTINSNLFLSSLNFSTNAAATGTPLYLNGGYQAISTNNNVSFTGFTFLNGTGNTNIAWTSVLIANTSGSLKTVTFAGVNGDLLGYVTNQSCFTVLAYPQMGTNVVFRALN